MRNCAIIHPLHLELDTALSFRPYRPSKFRRDMYIGFPPSDIWETQYEKRCREEPQKNHLGLHRNPAERDRI